MFVLVHSEKVYGPFASSDAATEYAFDRFGGGGRVEPLRPLDVMPRANAGIEPLTEAAIAQIYAIEHASALLVVKCLTIQDVLLYDECEFDATGVELTADAIRATDGWRKWHEHNDLDDEELAQIAYDARKILAAAR